MLTFDILTLADGQLQPIMSYRDAGGTLHAANLGNAFTLPALKDPGATLTFDLLPSKYGQWQPVAKYREADGLTHVTFLGEPLTLPKDDPRAAMEAVFTNITAELQKLEQVYKHRGGINWTQGRR